MLASGMPRTKLPDYYPHVNHLRNECNDVLEGVKKLEDTNLKHYIKTSKDVIEFDRLLYEHAFKNMHSPQFFTRSKK